MLLLVSTTCGPILTEGFSILTTIWCLAFLGIFLSSGFLELHTFSNTVRTLEFTLFKGNGVIICLFLVACSFSSIHGVVSIRNKQGKCHHQVFDNQSRLLIL